MPGAVLINGELLQDCGLVEAMVTEGISLHICAVTPVSLSFSGALKGFCVLDLGCVKSIPVLHTGLVWFTISEVPSACTPSESAFVDRVIAGLKCANQGASVLHDILTERCPRHTETILRQNVAVNVFLADAAAKCVVRKKAKPRYHRKCPPVRNGNVILDVAKRSAFGEVSWKQCGASFSTIMRHFQKTPREFSWTCDEDNRTIIQAFYPRGRVGNT
jgi:hypothetical protein